MIMCTMLNFNYSLLLGTNQINVNNYIKDGSDTIVNFWYISAYEYAVALFYKQKK